MGINIDYNQRVEILSKIEKLIIENEGPIFKALYEDLGKSNEESYLTEIGPVLQEIRHAKNKLKKWMKPKRVRSSLGVFPSKAMIYSCPVGRVLIISPWNYPFSLAFSPLIGAIAAGNTAVVKPSEISTNTSKVISTLINDNFDKELVIVVEGGVQETTELLEQKFNHIFYTGNSKIARIVMKSAAVNLTPVTLELGGKSPCIVLKSANLSLSAKRIAWGKLINSGQTCVAPDYLILERSISKEFIQLLIEEFKKHSESSESSKIINKNHYDRILSYVNKSNIIYEGISSEETLKISPTIVSTDGDDNIMSEEIFGPILPIKIVDSYKDALEFSEKFDTPLSAYLFSTNKEQIKSFSREFLSGGICINDVVVHITVPNLPFGGVGESGIGSYHGKHSFDLFTHKKPVLIRSFLFENSIRYLPLKGKMKLFKFLYRWL